MEFCCSLYCRLPYNTMNIKHCRATISHHHYHEVSEDLMKEVAIRLDQPWLLTLPFEDDTALKIKSQRHGFCSV